MVRISGIDIVDKHLVHHALIVLYGVGSNNVFDILTKARVSPTKRVYDLSEEETKAIQKIIDAEYMVEGDLRRHKQGNIKRLRVIGTIRGRRHASGLPTRGQRTRTNARTNRGKRKTVGAMKKDDRVKMEQTDKQKK